MAVPPELEALLRAAVPISPNWADWRAGAHVVANKTREWIHRAFAFDIEQNQYWHQMFGVRPIDAASAVAQALAVVDAAPPLFPLQAHRFLCSAPRGDARGVLS